MRPTVAERHDSEKRDMRDVLCDSLIELAEKDNRIVLLDADLMNALNTRKFAERFPDRTFDCGIAEANMAGVAAGLGLNGFIPFIHTFGTFATRRIHDQVYLSGGYARSNVKILGTDPGVTATSNGGTHMPLEDIALMRAIPGMTVVEITDTTMLKSLLPQIAAAYGMAYIRMPRRLSFQVYEPGSEFEMGKAALLRDGADVAIFAIGYCVREALAAAEILAAEGIQASVYDMFSIKPLDGEAVVEAARRCGAVVTAENHNIIGGLGSAVSEILGEEYPVPVQRVGVRDRFGEVGTAAYLASTFGIVAEDIARHARQAVSRKNGSKRTGEKG